MEKDSFVFKAVLSLGVKHTAEHRCLELKETVKMW